jgi:hypothetical protein
MSSPVCAHPTWIYCNCNKIYKKQQKALSKVTVVRNDLCGHLNCTSVARPSTGFCRKHNPNGDHINYDEQCIYPKCGNYGFRKLNSNISYTGDQHRDHGFALYYCKEHKDYKCYNTTFCNGSNKTSIYHECDFDCAECGTDCTRHVTSGDWENCYSKGFYCSLCD